MKINIKTMKTIKLFALLAAMISFAACEKSDEPSIFHERDIIYIVNSGERQTVHISTEAELDSLLTSFCDHLGSWNGNSITFFDAVYENGTSATKETVTFNTTDREQLKAWMRRMEDKGKIVNVTYDAITGVYLGMAYASKRVSSSGNEWVNLGLPSGLLWASCNVGASHPEDYGDYFAWAETTPKPDYNWENYRYCYVDGAFEKFTKYCKYDYLGYEGYSDNLTVLEPSDDAATAYLGNGARTPTYYEWKELLDNCTSEWTTQNGVNGYRITGPNKKSIFLPAADMRSRADGFTDNNLGCYWSSTLGLDLEYGIDDKISSAWILSFSKNDIRIGCTLRNYGMPVRAVR